MLSVGRQILRVWSDLHFEYKPQRVWFDHLFKNKHDKNTDLVLLGDIDNVCYGNFADTMYSFVQEYRTVTVIPGNHEYYGMGIHEGNLVMERICKEVGANFLNNNFIMLNGIKLIGSTLWSHIDISNEKYRLMGDFKHIKSDFNPINYNVLYNDNIAYIKSELKRQPDIPCIILTHHAPTFRCLYNEKGKRRYPDQGLDTFFCTNLEHIFSTPNLIGWYFGHTHISFDQIISKKRVLSNPFGYERIHRKYGVMPKICDIRF